jgi:CDP-2,3-bis-(O-geranylgeranyl)-sn-glycerol synthase
MRLVLFTAAQVLYLLSPLLVSAALSGIVLRFDLIPALRLPLDGGLVLGGRRLFGDGKTWRGVATAIVGSVLAVALQKYVLAPHVGSLALVDYRGTSAFLLGLALGVGATAGELPNSFVKRRLAIPPGGTTHGSLRVVFYLWDQLDLLTGTWSLLLFWIRPSLLAIGVSVLLVLAIHPLVALIGYLIGARKTAR